MPPSSSPDLLVEVCERLERVYGLPTLGNKDDPLDELVYIVLSARTGFRQFEPGYDRLRARYQSWDDLAEAPVAEVELAIAGGGLAKKRASWLIGLLQGVRQRAGEMSLECLAGMSDEEAEAFLCALPGVGPKTARCVLMYSLHRDLFPVDTHARRLLERLGVLDPGLHQLKANDRAQELVPKGFRRSLHILFVAHGRAICKSPRPFCSECVLADLCPSTLV